MFDRLLGLETEYAIRFVSSRDTRPTNLEIYDELAKVVGTLVPTRSGRSAKRERFLANGGLLCYEEQQQLGDGMVETGTPECRGPSEVILYQRAHENLLVRAMSQVGPALGGEMTLLKNCRDAEGHTYGAQENYEVEIARGGSLFAWRAGLIALLPLNVMSVLVMWLLVVVMVPTILALLLGVALVGLVPGMKWLTRGVGADGRVLRMLRPMIWVEHAVWGLSCVPFLLLFRACAFRQVRRGLVPFLISRPIISGAGTLVDDRFALSEKGVAVRRICRSSLARGVSVFDPGNLFKGVHGLTKLDFPRFAALFRRRQRLQIGFSDSNMSQSAEYLKVATTCLVIDMIEAGALPAPPRVRGPLRVLRQIVDGDHAAALALQRTYLEHARRFVREAAATPLEATEAIARWGAVLDAIENAPATLIGQLDWITKRELIEKAGTTPASRKKIDLKYHELATGYFAAIEARDLSSVLVTAEEARTACDHPPETPPARARARLIRDLADVAKVTVGWNRVRIGGPIRGRVIRLDDHR